MKVDVGNTAADLLEVKQRLQEEKKIEEDKARAEEDQDAVSGEELKDAEDVKDGSGGAAQGSSVLLQQQPSQGAMSVCWERFLHLRSLKVLLVENDDSIRHVVAALLRNCSYEG